MGSKETRKAGQGRRRRGTGERVSFKRFGAIGKVLLALLLIGTWALPQAGMIVQAEAQTAEMSPQATNQVSKFYGFGANYYGQLGLGDYNDRYIPTEMLNSGEVKQIAGGEDHTLVLMENGKVYGLGKNGYGQLGLANTYDQSRMTEIPGLSGVKQVATGYNHSLALTESGKVYAFGSNSYGQLGLGDTMNRSVPTEIPNLSGVKQLTAGMFHSLALTESGQVYAFGYGGNGALGLGDTDSQAVPTEIPNLSGVKQLATGAQHSLALTESGQVYVFGYGALGALGLGDGNSRVIPAEIPGLSGVKQVAAGYNHSLALTESGTVYSFGNNGEGQLGIENVNFQYMPTEIPNLSGVKQIAVGFFHNLALTEIGKVYAFGWNGYGQLGLGDNIIRNTPTVIPSLYEVQQVAAGSYQSYVMRNLNVYTVTFDSFADGMVTEESVSHGSLATRPTDPTRDGYAFGGWYTDSSFGQVFDFTTPITADTTVYAKWTDIQPPVAILTTTAGNPTNRPFDVTVTFDEDVTSLDDSRIEVTNGEAGTVSQVSDRIYTFGVAPTSEGAVAVKLLAGASADTAGNASLESASLQRYYYTTSPTLTLTGEARMAVAIGSPFTEPGAMAHDALGEDLTGAITVTGTVDPNQANTYVLEYGVRDRADNAATVTRSVYVIEPPLMQLIGPASLALEQDAAFVDPGAAASDTFHGDLSEAITVEGTVDTGKPGVYTLTYKVTNPIGQSAQAQRVVTVEEKIVPPVIPPITPPVTPAPSGDSGVTFSNPPIFPADPVVRSTTGTLVLPAGSAGELSLGSAVRLQIPAGATNSPVEIRLNALTTANNGLNGEVRPLASTYELTGTGTANLLRPVSLTFTFDPSKLRAGEQAAVFYQTEAGAPWVRIEGAATEGGRNALGTASAAEARITVAADRFARFAVLAVSGAAAPDPAEEAPEIGFADMTGHWAAASIRRAAALGIVKGYADGTFRPSGAVTRAEFTTMLVRALQPAGSAEPLAADLPFADAGSIRGWALESAVQAQQLGWIQGDPAGNFRSDAPITRAEMAVMLSRALNLPAGDPNTSTSAFADTSKIPAWAREAAAALAKTGLVQGRSGGLFAPSETATRAEVVQVLMTAKP